MNIGDRVVSRQTGLPGVGTVCGVVTAKFLTMIQQGFGQKDNWNLLYPNWIDKYVYYVQYDEARYVQSYDEFILEMIPASIASSDLKVLYKYSPMANIIAYPQDDLEIFEHETSSISSN